MEYNEIANQTDHRGACTLYVSEVYGVEVVQQLPSVIETLWDCILFGMPEGLAHIAIYSDNGLPPPSKK
ncbi:hypothetical protein [Pseudomonas sp. TH31]|uniref:hypothetical protein n=1 Tax=Pseudomonas sp. TH31 TaxID=2796396 RepID=UPI001913A56B|nr:hypothetical protein [Pseudomonas sp. TH31]MBK5416704.1 hypothetical protein [Pseudomonas sp. TH31]